MVEVNGKPILTHCFEQLAELGADEFVVGYMKEVIIEHYGDEVQGVPITSIDAIKIDGWRTDIGYPEDRDAAEERLQKAMNEEAASAD